MHQKLSSIPHVFIRPRVAKTREFGEACLMRRGDDVAAPALRVAVVVVLTTWATSLYGPSLEHPCEICL